MVLDDNPGSDKAVDASDSVDAGRIGQHASPHNTLATSELASGQAKSINTYRSWYDTEEGC